MKPEDLSPAQALQLVALGFILLSLLCASVTSWSVLIFRINKGLRFQSSSKPTATVGFIDCLIGFLAIVFCFSLAIATWRTFINPPPIESFVFDSQPAIQSDQPAIAPTLEPAVDSAKAEVSGSTESANVDAKTNGAPNEEPSSERQNGSKDETKKTITREDVLGSGWVSVFQLLAAFITMVIVAGRIGWNWRALGLNTSSIFRDIGIGIWVLLLMLPPIFLINIATNLASGIEYNHPIIDAIKNYPLLVGVVAFQAVIVAPITEEFLFRGLLIGWFESAHFGSSASAILFGWNPNNSSVEEVPVEHPFTVGGENNTGPYSSAVVKESSSSSVAERYSPPWWPAILSGVLFGLAHFSYGVSWVPLVVFGIILGRVYQLRQSLIMCIAVHMLFNGINILNFWLSLGIPTNK